MTERRANERRNWKGEVFPYDITFPDETKECSFCLTDKQAEIIRGIIEPLAWSTRWWSDTQVIDQDTIEAFRDDIIRRLMMGCCGDEIPVQFRYTEDGILQRSEDGGTTWTDAPEYDPRNYSPQFPPPSGDDGDDKKCIAATSASLLIKEQVGDQLTDDMSRYTLGQLISDWTNTMINSGGNIFQALVTIVTNQIFALVIATLRPALTDDVYDKLKCAFFNNIGDDASVNEAQWSAVRSSILSTISGIAGIFLEHLVYLLGVVGTSNLLRSGAAIAGDCSACTDTDHIRVFVSTGGGTEDDWDGEFLTASPVLGGDSFYHCFVQYSNAGGTLDQDVCGQIDSITALSGAVDNYFYKACHDGTFVSTGITPVTDICACQWDFRSSAPFQLKISALTCS